MEVNDDNYDLEHLFQRDDFSSEAEQEHVESSFKFDYYERQGGPTLKLALVKQHHSLWAEFIYNAARVIADMIEKKHEAVEDLSGKSWLELGSGAGLPSIVCALHHPACIVISDFGNDYDKCLLPAIDYNIQYAMSELGCSCPMHAVGYIWGHPVEPLTKKLAGNGNNGNLNKFDYVVMADCIFNRSEHRKLLWTVKETLNPDCGIALCSFSHHDPQKESLDLAFFDIARDEFGFFVEKIHEESRASYPFVENDGLDSKRGARLCLITVYCTLFYYICWAP
jgi:nicotinamide N-methyltransferase